MLDLYHASRDDLIEVVVAQREALADRDRRLAELEADLAIQRATIAQLIARVGALGAALGPAADESAGDGDGPTARGMPGLKPTQPPAPPRRARTRRARGVARS